MGTDITARLKPYVRLLQASAAAGDEKAQQIINLHRMHCACPADPGAPALCASFFEDWLKSNA
jgi:hypothetical protein